MNALKRSITITFLTFAVVIKTFAQNNSVDQSLLTQINNDNKTAIDAIAMYPEGMRTSIFTACMYPEIIVRLNTMQKKTNADFTNLLSTMPKDEQEKIWNLTRYPDLLSKLAETPQKSDAEIAKISETYPADIRETASLEGTKNHELLVKISQSNAAYNSDFDQMLKGYDQNASNTFKALIKQPDILTILADNMHMTIVVGDLYKKNPALVIHNADSLNFVLTEKNKEETAEWQKSLDANPAAKQQYEQAANEYAQENGYQSQQYAVPNQNDLMYYNSYPYNWWFGYPTWYGYSYWRPYPYWYDWGYYYGPGHRMMYYGMPSARFFSWYWYRNENHYRYSEFSSHCYGYYNNHRGAYGYNPICRGVYDWRINNRGIVGRNWDVDNAHRVVLFKEYGQMEIGRANHNAQNPQQVLSNQEYLKMNQERYPTLNTGAIQAAQEQRNTSPQQEFQNRGAESKPSSVETIKGNDLPRNNPAQTVSPQQEVQHSTVQPQYSNPQQPVQHYAQPQNNAQPQIQHYNTQPQNNTQQEIQHSNPQSNYPQQQHNAQEYHQNSWQQTQPAPSRPSYQPAPSRPAYQPMQSAPVSRPSFSAPAARPSQSAPAARPSNSGGFRR